MSRSAILIHAGVMAIIALFSARTAIRSAGYILEGRSSGAALLIVAGWLLATFTAPLLSIFISTRRWRADARWAPHMLFIPCAITGYWVGTSMFFAAADAGGDNIVAEYALVSATALLLLTLLFHAAAMVRAVIAATPRSADDRQDCFPRVKVVLAT